MNKKIFYLVLTVCALAIISVIGAYAIGVGFLGDHSFSFGPDEWQGFASYFNNMLSPILALGAALIAYLSLKSQIGEIRKEASLNQQISNALSHINLQKEIINKRWVTISEGYQQDWELEQVEKITIENIIKVNSGSQLYLLDLISIFRLFDDLSKSAEHYAALHKRITNIEGKDTVLMEWARFPESIIQEQDKKMQFCYELCKLWKTQPNRIKEEAYKEVIIFLSFYEGLIESKTLRIY